MNPKGRTLAGFYFENSCLIALYIDDTTGKMYEYPGVENTEMVVINESLTFRKQGGRVYAYCKIDGYYENRGEYPIFVRTVKS